jgi:OOP family OmpA-OmpF porin
MSSSLISTLMNSLDRTSIGDVAARLGESEESVSRGLGSSFAAILSGMANKTGETGTTRQLFDLITAAPTDSLNLASADAPSPLADLGRRMLPMVFGGNQSAISEAIGRTSGLSFSSASRLLSMAAPLVLGFLSRRVRDEGMTLSGFTGMLQRESADLRSHLPASLSSLIGISTPATHAARATGVYDTEPVRRSASRWLAPVLAALAIFFGIFWFLNRHRSDARRAAESAAARITEGTDRARSAVSNLGDFVTRQLPNDIRLHIPEHGVEARLLSFIQDTSLPVSTDTWFDFDRLHFDTASATLRPESTEQLQNIASIMRAYPNVRLKIGGYTDNVGDPASNLRLSQNRAESVRHQLISMGIAAHRLEAEGYGEQHPIADNTTAEGRAMNRRISMRVLQK